MIYLPGYVKIKLSKTPVNRCNVDEYAFLIVHCVF